MVAGIIVTAALLIGTWTMRDSVDMGKGQIYGYGFMLVGCAIIIAGMRKAFLNGIALSFKEQFQVGLGMSLLMSLFYTVGWMIFYHTADINFEAHYQQYMEAQWEAQGFNADMLEAKKTEMDQMMEMYRQPVYMFLFTLLEIFPIGLFLSLLTAWYFGKKGMIFRKPSSTV